MATIKLKGKAAGDFFAQLALQHRGPVAAIANITGPAYFGTQNAIDAERKSILDHLLTDEYHGDVNLDRLAEHVRLLEQQRDDLRWALCEVLDGTPLAKLTQEVSMTSEEEYIRLRSIWQDGARPWWLQSLAKKGLVP